MKRFCQGCGIQLQSDDPVAPGYVQAEYLTTGLCQRCFKIKQYSDFQKVELDNTKVVELIEKDSAQNELLTLVIDLSDFVETCLFELAASFRSRKLVVVVNKIDILAKDLRHYDLWKTQLMALFTEHDLYVEAFFFVSAKQQLGMRRLIAYYEMQSEQAIKFVGCANVGKSSLIQALFRDTTYEQTVMPTIFMAPGTTLDVLQIPWGTKTLYDTPGVMKPTQLTYYLNVQALKRVSMQRELRPKHYQIYEPQTFFIGGYAQIDLHPETTNTVTFFVPQAVKIHRKKLVQDDAFFQMHQGKLLSPPTKSDLRANEQLLERAKHRFVLERPKRDIVIAGLGWFSVKKAHARVEVYAVAGVHVYEQAALV